MRNIFLAIVSTFSFGMLSGQTGDPIPLWPDDPQKAQAQAYVYFPETTPRQAAPAVVICPGGGYQALALGREGHDAARWFAREGFVALVLKYRMPKGDPQIPFQDACQAFRLLKKRQDSWRVDTSRVGVVGFSAGGHLAATLCTLPAEDADRPDFAVLFYPVIDMADDSVTHAASRANLLGEKADDPAWRLRYSADRQADGDTPPTLLLLSGDDREVPPVNSTAYYAALHAHGVSVALCMFPSGDHGWGFRPSFAYHEAMTTLVRAWLTERGIAAQAESKEAVTAKK